MLPFLYADTCKFQLESVFFKFSQRVAAPSPDRCAAQVSRRLFNIVHFTDRKLFGN